MNRPECCIWGGLAVLNLYWDQITGCFGDTELIRRGEIRKETEFSLHVECFLPTHRCPGLRWKSAVWKRSAGPCWCAPRSSQTCVHRCAWRVRRGRWPPASWSYSSRTSQTSWPTSCDRASAPSAAAPPPAACRSISGGRRPSATHKQQQHTPSPVSGQTLAPSGPLAGGTPTHRDVAGFSVSLRADLDVAQVKDGGDNFEDVTLTAVLYS